MGLAALALLGLRLYGLGNHVLFDTTEARYAEVARLMLASGDWVTPQNDPGVPFWAKPPLYAWAGAASMAAFGVSEFAVRLPSVLFAALTLALVWAWANSAPSRPMEPPGTSGRTGAIASAVLGSMALFFVSAGAMMTEASLLLCTTGMTTAFWFSVVRTERSHPAWPWSFFVFAGLGMLAKGPVAWVYAGLPIVAWVIWRRPWGRVWTQLPWLRGSLLAVAIFAPWYVAAELRTPGYWEYFFIGEHFKRFTQPGWSGDMYGNAHIEARGTIWLFFLASAMPWTPLAAWQLFTFLRQRFMPSSAPLHRTESPDETTRFLLLCVFAPLVFFTFSRNIIWTYVLPALPALAILLARRWASSRATFALLGLSILLLGTYFTQALPRIAHERSAAQTVGHWLNEQPQAPGPLVFLGSGKPPHSAKFYSQAQALAAPTLEAAVSLRSSDRIYLALPVKDGARLHGGALSLSGRDATQGLRKVARSSAYELVVLELPPATTP